MKPVIKVDYNVFDILDETKVPVRTTFHTLDCFCENCGNTWRIPLQEQNRNEDAEAKHWKQKYESLNSYLNEIIKHIDTHYNLHPTKDMITEKLLKLRDKLDREDL